MPIQHAVLSLLTDGPCHGYELRAAFERAVGPQWGGLNIGHLYQMLERLSRDGLVDSSTVTQADRPDRRVYRLTAAGRDELTSWVAAPAERTGGYRDELFLKLMAAAREGEQAVRDLADAQRRHEYGRLKSLGELAREHRDEPLVALLIEAAALHTRADLELVELAAESAAGLVAGAEHPPTTAEHPSTAESSPLTGTQRT